MIAQRTSREAKAKRKQAEKEANHENRVREKEERQWQVREHAHVRETNRNERERHEAENRVASGRKRRRGGASESLEAANPPQLQPTPTTTLRCNRCGGHHPPTAPTDAHTISRASTRSRCLQWVTPISVLVDKK